MSDNKVVHYKKTFTKYDLHTYKDTLPIDYVSDDRPIFTRKIPKRGYWSGIGTESVSEEEFLKNYGNRLVGISSHRMMVVIEEIGDKISIKSYSTYSARNVGTPYFRTEKLTKYITYNKRTKNFYSGDIRKKRKRIISKKVRVNNFNEHIATQLMLFVRREVRDITNGNGIIKNGFGDSISEEVFNEYFGLLSLRTKTYFDRQVNDIDVEMFRFYLSENNIKYPDNYHSLSNIVFYKNKLKKYKNLVTYIMSELNLKGKKVRELINKEKDINLHLINDLFKLLGVDYFNTLNTNAFIQSDAVPSKILLEWIKDSNVRRNFYNLNFSNTDKQRMVNVLNSRLRYSLLCDHLDMISKLKTNYSHDFKMKFVDVDSFDKEHYELSELYSSYKKGEVTRFYGEISRENIELPIMGTDGIDYHPVLLLTSSDYNKESQVQSNCVRTYVEKPSSLIISLREGSTKSEERATIEYQFRRNEIVRVQSLGKHNKNLTKRYDVPLEILDERISNLYKKNVIELPQMVKEFKSGYKIERKSYFDDDSINLLISSSGRGTVNNISGNLPVWDNNEETKEDFFDWDLFM